MCLAIPGQIKSITGDDELTRQGRVAFGGIIKVVNLAFAPDAAIGDYVLVHAGFAISRMDREEAAQILRDLRQIGALEEPLAGNVLES